jgi:hypothetical protein
MGALWIVLIGAVSVRAGQASALPDGRRWEMVSPPSKHGAGIEAIPRGGGPTQASDFGGAVTYAASGPVVAEAPSNRGPELAQILSVRSSSGSWTTQDIIPPHSALARLTGGRNSEYDVFSNSLSLGLVEPEGSTPLAPKQTPDETQERTIYLRADTPISPAASEETAYQKATENGAVVAPPGYLPLVDGANAPGKTIGDVEANNVVEFQAGSPDLSAVVFTSPEALTANAVRSEENDNSLYEWTGGSLHLVSLLPRNEKGEELPAAQANKEAALGSEDRLVRNAVSSDGSRVVWEAGRHLYLRDTRRGETIELDAPQAEAESELASPEPVFQGASSDGSKIFFTDAQRLTKDARAQEREPDLYVFEVTGAGDEPMKGRTTNLTKDVSPEPEERANVRGDVLGYSENGTTVFFVANGVLGETAASPGDCRTEGVGEECNVYMDRYNGSEWELRLVAQVSSEDEGDWAARSPGNLGLLTARVSPNGRYLAFMSNKPLTGYDSRDVASGVADEEVYLFDSDTGRMVCASCNPTAARPEGVRDPLQREGVGTLLVDRAEAWSGSSLAGSIPGWTEVDLGHALYQSRYLTNEGRLFFDGADSLVPADVNGKEDVYQYQPEGPHCNSSTDSTTEVFKRAGGGEGAAGCVALISSGTSALESAFLDASAKGPDGEEGEDVFFLTTSQLAPQDTDSAFDVYDAHRCTPSSPCPTPETSVNLPPCDEADACRSGSPTQPTIYGSPPSETAQGGGNLSASATSQPTRLSRAAMLIRALATCHKKPRKQRLACERRARRQYGPARRAKRSGRWSR